MKKHSSDYYIGIAKKNNLSVYSAKGSHTKVVGYTPDGTRSVMIIPRGKDLSPGVENNVRKWFIKLGIVLSILLFAYGVVSNYTQFFG